MIKGRDYEIYITKKAKREHQDESKEKAQEAMTVKEMVQDHPVPLFTYISIFLHSIFFNDEVYINYQQIQNSIEINAPYFTFQTTSRKSSLISKEFCTGKGMTMKNLVISLWTLPRPIFFAQEVRKCSETRWFYIKR